MKTALYQFIPRRGHLKVIMNSRHFFRFLCWSLALAFLATLFSINKYVYAQSLSAPKNIKFLTWSCYAFGIKRGTDGWENAPLPFVVGVSYDSVPGANSYRLDVAEDSAFTNIVVGLKGYQERPPFNNYLYPRGWNWLLRADSGRAMTTIYGLVPGHKPYYFRVRAANGAMESAYSTVATTQTGCAYNQTNCPCSTGGRIIGLTDTSITINAWSADAPKVYIWQDNKFLLSVPNGIAHIGRFAAETSYKINVLGFYPTPISFKTLPTALSRFASVISFYEGPEDPTTTEEKRYYYRPFPIGTDMRTVLAEFETIRSQKIGWDTAWYHSGSFIGCIGGAPDPCNGPWPTFQDSVKATLIVKTRAPDERMERLGYTQGFPRPPTNQYYTVGWRYGNDALYYRMLEKLQVSASEAPAWAESLSVFPNPLAGAGIVRYALSEAAEVSVEALNVLGHKVWSQASAFQSAGEHTVTFDASALAAGTYFLRLEIKRPNGETRRRIAGVCVTR